MSVCVYVQHASACQHGRVTIDQDIFLHHVPVSTYVAPLVKLLASTLVFVLKSLLSSVARPLKIHFREARPPPSSDCTLRRHSRRCGKADRDRTCYSKL